MYVPISNTIWTIMDEEGSAGSEDDTEKIKEIKSIKEAIKTGMDEASDT